MSAASRSADELRGLLEECGDALATDQTWWYGYPDYVAELSLTPGDVPALVEVARLWVAEGYWVEQKDKPEGDTTLFAPVHAWRAVAQLGVEAAGVAAEVVALFEPLDDRDDDWLSEELAEATALLGPATLDPLEEPLGKAGPERVFARVAAVNCMERIANRHPETRDDVIARLVRKLETHAGDDDHRDDATVYGFVVNYLVDLKATEAAEAIERAFAAGAVDDEVLGDWPWVRYELGLGEKPRAGTRFPRRRAALRWLVEHPPEPPRHDNRSKLRKKKKQQRKNKKRNRR